MTVDPTRSLLSNYPDAVQKHARKLIAIITQLVPEVTTHVYPTWRGIGFRHPRCGYIGGVFLWPDRVQFGFERGVELPDPQNALSGDGSQVRYVVISAESPIPQSTIETFFLEALALPAKKKRAPAKKSPEVAETPDRQRTANPKTTGYSGTPLAKKLGIKPSFDVLVLDHEGEHRDVEYIERFEDWPDGATVRHDFRAAVDLVHVFATDLKELEKHLKKLRTAVGPSTAVWVSWPKKSSKVKTDITEDRIRDVALPMDWVDIKVCAIDDIWSGLKLVIRKEAR